MNITGFELLANGTNSTSAKQYSVPNINNYQYLVLGWSINSQDYRFLRNTTIVPVEWFVASGRIATTIYGDSGAIYCVHCYYVDSTHIQMFTEQNAAKPLLYGMK